MGKFITFERMITPIFIQLLFWISFIAIIISSFIMIGYGIVSSQGSWMHVVGGIIFIFISPIVLRVYCEILIVVFKMQQALNDIRNHMQPLPTTSYEREEEIV